MLLFENVISFSFLRFSFTRRSIEATSTLCWSSSLQCLSLWGTFLFFPAFICLTSTLRSLVPRCRLVPVRRFYSTKRVSTLEQDLQTQLAEIKQKGLYKSERIITSPQNHAITVQGSTKPVLNCMYQSLQNILMIIRFSLFNLISIIFYGIHCSFIIYMEFIGFLLLTFVFSLCKQLFGIKR